MSVVSELAALFLRANEMKDGTKVDCHLSDEREAKTEILGGYRRHKLADIEKGILPIRVFSGLCHIIRHIFSSFP